MCRSPFICVLFCSTAYYGASQVLWSEAYPNNPCAAARREALGVSLLFEAWKLDSYTVCAHAARRRTTRTLRAPGRLRLADTHRIPPWRERGALAREWYFGRPCPWERRSDGTEVGRLLEHVAVAVSQPCHYLPLPCSPLNNSDSYCL